MYTKRGQTKQLNRQKAILYKRLFFATLLNKILLFDGIFTYFQ